MDSGSDTEHEKHRKPVVKIQEAPPPRAEEQEVKKTVQIAPVESEPPAAPPAEVKIILDKDVSFFFSLDVRLIMYILSKRF